MSVFTHWKKQLLLLEGGTKNIHARRIYNNALLAAGRVPAKRAPRISRKKSSSKKKQGIATKTNPKLWEKAKKMACSKGKLCKHSARKMQWATNYYKKNGGKYRGTKKSNKLTKWGKEKWTTSDGTKSKGKKRYLPKKAWEALSESQKKRTNKAKLKGFKQGKQYTKNPKDVAKIAKKYR